MIEDPYETKTFRPRAGRVLLVLVAALVFVAVGVLLLSTGHVVLGIVGVVAIVFFGLGALLIVVRLFVRRSLLVLAPSGLTSGSYPEVAWSQVSHMSVVTIRGQPMLLVHLRDEDAYLERLSGMNRALAVANQRMCRASITLPVRDIGLPVEKLAAEIEGRRLQFGES